ncbi:MAG: gfo/Idh/MocA family oxidoreductase, partial [Rhizobiales bacterium]|nr:gfo/Idh/MocA family oxidoreductase [Hyphomicrobiales bacterium]
KGSVSIIADNDNASSDVDSHTKTSNIRIHHAQINQDGEFVKSDENLTMQDEPNHQELCELEQAFVQKAINKDLDLTAHMSNAVESLRICLAADLSIRSNKTVYIKQGS